MGDMGAVAWTVLGWVSAQINSGDFSATLLLFVLSLLGRLTLASPIAWGYERGLKAARDYFKNLFDSYVYRFTVRGFRFETCRHSLWLALLLWVHTFLVLSLWPTWVGIIVLSALAAILSMSILGYRARGPRGNIRRFAIFYEPSLALMSTLVMGKLPDVASRALSKLVAALH
jgi:hypothetical protein